MKLIGIGEFQNITGLSNQALVWLIKHNKLHFEYNKSKGLQVDMSQVSKNELIESMLENVQSTLEEDKQMIKERLARVISDQLEELLDEALADLLK